jgi:hypothetical protein
MSDTPIIYCDEAGFTGNNLLDPTQPYFVFGSVDIENSHAQELIDEAKSKFRLQAGDELKGHKLMKHGKGRSAIKWLMQECERNFHLVFSDKKFAIAGQFFEIMFEPLISSHNTAFYKIDFHRFITNIIYYSMKLRNPLVMEAVDNIQSIFDKRDNPTTLISNQRLDPKLILDTIFYFCQLNKDAIRAQMDWFTDKTQSINKWYLDLSLTSLKSSLAYWAEKYSKLKVVCDESKPLSENEDIIRLMGLGNDGFLHINIRVPNFKVEGISFGKSHENPSIQLADIFSSSTAYAINKRDVFWKDLMSDFSGNFSNYNLSPDTQYIDFANDQTYRNAVILLRLIEESERPQGFSMNPELLRGLNLIQNVDLPALERAMSGENISNS